MSTTLRRLTATDAPEYRALRLRALREHPDAFTSDADEDARQPLSQTEKRLSAEDRAAWGAFDGDRMVGIVGLDRETRVKNRHKATLVGMYVAPEAAGRGLGRALVDTVLAEARRLGLELLVLTVTEGNAAATRLYEQAGFRSFGVEPRAIKVDGRAFAKIHMALEI